MGGCHKYFAGESGAVGGLDAIDAIDAIDAVDVGWLRAGYRAAAAMSVVQLRRRERRYAVWAVLAAD